MTKITDNATLRQYVTTQAQLQKTSIDAIVKKIAVCLGYSNNTVQGWLLVANPKPLTARTASLIQAAIERGEI